MGFSISSYITGWALPQEQDLAEQWLMEWQGQHSKDHENIYSALNSLQTALGNSAYKINMADLSFSPDRMDSIDNFLIANRFQHSEFYGWLNQLGAALAGYGKQPIIVYPKMNIVGPIMNVSGEMWSTFMGMERSTHMLTLSAINQIYGAYSL